RGSADVLLRRSGRAPHAGSPGLAGWKSSSQGARGPNAPCSAPDVEPRSRGPHRPCPRVPAAGTRAQRHGLTPAPPNVGVMRVGVDTGGTFTDVVADDGQVRKVPSTPADPSRRVLHACPGPGPSLLAPRTTLAT